MHNTTRMVLQCIYEQENPSLSDLASYIDKSRTTARNHKEKLEDKGLIEVKNTNQSDIISVTSQGKNAMLDNPLDLGGVNTSEYSEDPYFLHFFSVICEFEDKNLLPEDFRERFKEFDDIQVNDVPDFDRVEFTTERWVYRLTGRSLEVKLRGELTGKDVKTLKDRAWSQVMKGLNHFENLIDESLPRDRLQLRVNTQHVGARDRNVVKAFIDHLDVNTIWNPRDFRAVGDDGEIRIYCDASGPGGMLEGEAGNGGQVDGRMDTVEDDMSLLEDFTSSLVDNPGNARSLIEAPDRIDSLSRASNENRERIDSLEEFSESVRDVLSEVQEARSDEKQTRDALIELVRSNQNVVKQNQEIIERQEEMIEKQSEIIDSLQSEVEDLKDSKSLEARIRERFNQDPRYSKVFEHSMNDSLYAWSYENGSPECKKVLDEEVRALG